MDNKTTDLIEKIESMPDGLQSRLFNVLGLTSGQQNDLEDRLDRMLKSASRRREACSADHN